MGTIMFEVDEFIGENDFNLWKIRMKVLLVQKVLSHSIDEDAMNQLRQANQAKATDMDAQAHRVLHLSLGDEVLREVFRETKALAIWKKL